MVQQFWPVAPQKIDIRKLKESVTWKKAPLWPIKKVPKFSKAAIIKWPETIRKPDPVQPVQEPVSFDVDEKQVRRMLREARKSWVAEEEILSELQNRGLSYAEPRTLKESILDAAEDRNERIQENIERQKKWEITSWQRALRNIGEWTMFVFRDIIGEALWRWVEEVVPQGVQDFFSEWTEEVVESLAKTKGWRLGLQAIAKGAEAWEEYKKTNPDDAADIQWIINIWAGVFDAFAWLEVWQIVKAAWKKVAGKAWKEVIEWAGQKTLQQLKDEGVDNPQLILEAAEREAPTISALEKEAGLTADVKKRLQKDPELYKWYAAVAKARNVSDDLPSPLDYAAWRANKAVDALEEVLSNKWSKIGAFRETVKNIKVPQDKVSQIGQKFDDSLKKMGLEINPNTNKIVRGERWLKSQATEGEIKVLQELWDDYTDFSLNPDMDLLITLRDWFSNRINFAKTAAEVGKNVDDFARKLRSEIKKINESLIPEWQKKLLEEYSTLIWLIDDFRSYTKKRSWSEFLLKRVLSERGRQVRDMFEALKKHTGYDLMNDASYANVVINLIWNDKQKWLFRQEIKNAVGTAMSVDDAIWVLSGNPFSAANLAKKMFGFISPTKKVDKERVFMKAALEKTKK